MAPPTYGDLGKSCRDVFSKGYGFGLLKVDVKTTTSSGVNLSTGGAHTIEDGKFTGNLETKYKIPEWGLTLTEKWNTSNLCLSEISCQDRLAQGLKVSLEGTFNPDSGNKGGKLKTQYKMRFTTLDASIEGGDESNLSLNGAAVLAFKGFLGGCQFGFDTAETVLKNNNFALGYCGKDFQIHSSVENMELFRGSYYHRVSNRVEAGVQLSWKNGEETETKFGIGGRYLMDPSSAVRAKINNQSQIGIAYEQKIKEGVVMTLCSLINAKDFNDGGHQVGLALEFGM